MYERRERVAEVIREKISDFILREMEEDSLVSVTRVLLTKDLREAKVYISCLEKENPFLERLKKQASSIRTYLAKQISLRYTPNLSFFIEENGN